MPSGAPLRSQDAQTHGSDELEQSETGFSVLKGAAKETVSDLINGMALF